MEGGPGCAIVIEVVHIYILTPAATGVYVSVLLGTRLMGTKNSFWELQQHNLDLEEN